MNIHDRLLVLALLLASLNFSAMAAAQEQPLLHWNFDSQEATRATDLSGNGLHADVTAELVASAMGQAVAMDGDARKLVSIDLPEGKRLGMDSWTIMAMLRPQRFDIDDAQNRRRFVSYGAYPKTSVIVIEVTGDGCLSISLSYRDEDGNMKFTGASSGFAMIRDAWSHVAVVCDRQNGRVILYLNGFPIGNAALPEHYQPDYGDSGRLTVGSNWHNFIGLIDDVTIYRAALSPDSVKTSYERLCDAFKPVDSEELAAARSDAKLREQFDKIRVAWKQGQWAGVRRLCQELIDAADAPAHYCSYAHLRIAQSYLAERNTVAALDVYQTIAATAAYPNVHREEARQSADELRRVSEGLPLQDPAASRTEVPVIESFAAEVFVGSDGDDDNGGTRTEPFATLTRARDELRKLKARAVDGPKAVTVLPGRYPITGPLELSAEDSGDSSAAIVYRADEPGSVVFYGGRRLSGFVDVTDEAIRDRLPAESRDRVVQCDLKAMGISDYGKLRVRGFSQGPSPPTLELFVDGVPM
ncbi:MAG TPA: LamG domain-containing protein, partial [Thermoguttaceae bacterium]|nr:LamG domain-containing protein [Thermoguttaceae bacterium]